MTIDRRSIAEKSLQIDLPGSRCKKIRTANNLCDAGIIVVDNDRQMISKRPISPLNDKITALYREYLGKMSGDTVIKTDHIIIDLDAIGTFSFAIWKPLATEAWIDQAIIAKRRS